MSELLEATVALLRDVRLRYKMREHEPFSCPYMQRLWRAVQADKRYCPACGEFNYSGLEHECGRRVAVGAGELQYPPPPMTWQGYIEERHLERIKTIVVGSGVYRAYLIDGTQIEATSTQELMERLDADQVHKDASPVRGEVAG